MDLPGRTLGAAPADRDVYADSVLSQADTTAGDKVVNWLNRIGAALNTFMWEDDDPSVIESSAFGSVYGTASEGSSSAGSEYMGVMPAMPTAQSDLEVLHDMFSMVMKASLAENESMRKKFGEINAYYGAMAISIGLSPYEVMASLSTTATREERQELANEIFKAFKADVMEKAASMRGAPAELSVHKRPSIDIPGNVGKRRASVLIENLRKRIHRDYSAPTSVGIYKDQAPIGPGQRKPGFPGAPRAIPTKVKKGRRDLQVDTGVAKKKMESGEQFYPGERGRVASGKPMDKFIPYKGKRRVTLVGSM